MTRLKLRGGWGDVHCRRVSTLLVICCWIPVSMVVMLLIDILSLSSLGFVFLCDWVTFNFVFLSASLQKLFFADSDKRKKKIHATP